MFDRRPTSEVITTRIDGPSEGAPLVHHRVSKDLIGLLRTVRADESDDRRIAVLRRIQEIYDKGAGSLSIEHQAGTLRATNAVLSARLELDAQVASVAMSPDGSLMAVLARPNPSDPSECRLELYSTEHTLLGRAPVLIDSAPFAGSPQKVMFSPDARSLALCFGETISVVPIELERGGPRFGNDRRVFDEPAFQIKTVSFDRTGSRLAVSASCTQYLHEREGQWQIAALEIATGKRLASLTFDRAVPAAGFSGDGRSLMFSIKETETHDVERGRIGRLFGLKAMRVERSYSKIKVLPLDRPGAKPADLVAEEDLPDFSCFAVDGTGKILRAISGSTISIYSIDPSHPGLAKREGRLDMRDQHIEGTLSSIAGERACIVTTSYDYKRIRDDYWASEVSEFLGGRQSQMILDLRDARRCSASITDASLKDAVERRAVSLSGDGKRLCIATPMSDAKSPTAVLLFEV